MRARIWNFSEWIKETNPKLLKKDLTKLLKYSGFGILGLQEHYFKPQGYSALWLLKESHLAIHTFPEESKTYLELSSCNQRMYNKFYKSIDRYFEPN
jgi:S-adenosylmethionine/arginine decarboxylase-like enzyme